MKVRKKKKVYALYKGDVNLCDGTIKEIADKMNLSEETIRFYKSNTYKKRRNESDNFLELVLIEDEYKYEVEI